MQSGSAGSAMRACYSLRVTWILGIVALFGSLAPAQAGGPLTPADGRELEGALARILLNAAVPRGAGERRVVITERAVNGFLRFQGADQLPPGLSEPELRMEAGGRLTVTATVDLDAVREQQAPGRFNPLRFLGGRLPVTAVGVVRSASPDAHHRHRVGAGGIAVRAGGPGRRAGADLHALRPVSRRDRRGRADSRCRAASTRCTSSRNGRWSYSERCRRLPLLTPCRSPFNT